MHMPPQFSSGEVNIVQVNALACFISFCHKTREVTVCMMSKYDESIAGSDKENLK